MMNKNINGEIKSAIQRANKRNAIDRILNESTSLFFIFPKNLD